MSPRERILNAVNRRATDKCPKDIGFTPAVVEEMIKRTNSNNIQSFFELETRSVSFAPSKVNTDFTPYMVGLPDDVRVSSEYGTLEKPGHFFHFSQYYFPLRDAKSVKEIEDYPWPRFTDAYRHEHLDNEIASIHNDGYAATAFCGHIFETAWQLIGFERFFECMIDDVELITAILDHITADNIFKARRFAEAGIDILMTGDDVGMQDRMMMSVAQWRKLLKPRLAAEIQAARDVQPNIPVWYHSDGDIMPIIDDLIEVGVTILNPVQPECLDVVDIKKKYGDQLAFWGTIGTQTVMPFGTPDDVRATIKSMIELFAPGIVIAPTHVLEPDVPWDNIIAFKEAVEEYGNYVKT